MELFVPGFEGERKRSTRPAMRVLTAGNARACIHGLTFRDQISGQPVTLLFLQIILWGALFMHLGEFTRFTVAVYHSAVNFATLGYGDIVMSEHRRVLGPMQSINGVLMVGVSTAVTMTALQDALHRTRKARESKT